MSGSQPTSPAVIDALAGALTSVLGAEFVQRDAPLGERSTYRVGGRAALLVELTHPERGIALSQAVRRVAPEVPLAVVGNGSNLLVADAGFEGLVVVLGARLARVEVEGSRVRAGGAALLPVVARRTVAAGLRGFEWAVGVPGSIGGAVRMNAGGHGSDMATVLDRVRVLDVRGGEDGWVHAASLGLSYRHSTLRASQVVLEAELVLEPGDVATGEALLGDIVRWRRANQPGGPNAGSVFTNPPGDSAGRLIEAAGAKGLRHGSAEISTKHANFIQADPGGRADDVLALMQEVQALVKGTFGVTLTPETQLLGYPRWSPEALPPTSSHAPNPAAEVES